jgi:hypothetical protein
MSLEPTTSIPGGHRHPWTVGVGWPSTPGFPGAQSTGSGVMYATADWKGATRAPGEKLHDSQPVATGTTSRRRRRNSESGVAIPGGRCSAAAPPSPSSPPWNSDGDHCPRAEIGQCSKTVGDPSEAAGVIWVHRMSTFHTNHKTTGACRFVLFVPIYPKTDKPSFCLSVYRNLHYTV